MRTDVRVSVLRLPLTASVTHATATRVTTESVWVEVARGDQVGFGEGCPRPYVTGESTEGATEWLREVAPRVLADVRDVGDLRAYVEASRDAIDVHPAAWCALELAMLDVLGRAAGVSVERLLDVAEDTTTFRYSAVVDDGDDARFARLTGQYEAAGLDDYKLKLRGDASVDGPRVSALLGSPAVRRLRVDANNLWGDDPAAAATALGSLEAGVVAVEEPLAAGLVAESSWLSTSLGLAVILDESLTRRSDVAAAAARGGDWIANVKVSKCGGLLRSLGVITAAREAGWPIIIGAQVGETSVLTRAGIVAARAADRDLFAHEGAFGTRLLVDDVVRPVLGFGPGGVLDLASVSGLATVGLGLTLADTAERARP